MTERARPFNMLKLTSHLFVASVKPEHGGAFFFKKKFRANSRLSRTRTHVHTHHRRRGEGTKRDDEED
jgi:hypothetical protein